MAPVPAVVQVHFRPAVVSLARHGGDGVGGDHLLVHPGMEGEVRFEDGEPKPIAATSRAGNAKRAYAR